MEEVSKQVGTKWREIKKRRSASYTLRTDDMYHRWKIQSKGGGGCRDMSAIVGFNYFVKLAGKLNWNKGYL